MISVHRDPLAARVAARFIRTANSPLYGHTGPENAYMVDDYPYGARLRCRIRYWLESGGKKGWRFVSQTEDPRNLRWNNPKKSTYSPLAACMYLDGQHHVQWSGVTEYSNGSQALDFVKAFPHADFSNLKPFVVAKINYLQKSAAGKVQWLVNGVPQPITEEDMGRSSKELQAWEEVAKHVH